MLKFLSENKRIFGGLILAVLAGGLIGWFAAVHFRTPVIVNQAIREGGYEFVNPLLTCSIDTDGNLNSALRQKIRSTVDSEIRKGNINTASVYFRGFGGTWAYVNEDERYYPASLGKLPLMIAYYSLSEASESPVLSRKIYFSGQTDANEQQEIKPEYPILPGKSYTVSQLIEAMIRGSDNNATQLLFANIDQNHLKNVFSDLKVPFLEPGMPPSDFMKVKDYAFFFRVLYNGTYLSHSNSEKSLKLLSETNFKQGIAAGVPPQIVVAHKFGLVSIAPDNEEVKSRELHDCGIIYSPENPYILCVMTKSKSSLESVEAAIARISKSVYDADKF